MKPLNFLESWGTYLGDAVELFHLFFLSEISSTLTPQMFWSTLPKPNLVPAAEGHHLLAGMSPHTGVKYAATRLSVGLHIYFSNQCDAIFRKRPLTHRI